MAGIKGFLLKALGFFLLAIAFAALSLSFTLYFLDGEIKALQSTAVTALAPFVSQAMGSSQNGFSSIDFDQIAAYCLSDPEMQMLGSTAAAGTEIVPKDTCQLVNSGAIADKDALAKHISEYALKSASDSLIDSAAPQLEFLRNVQVAMFLVFLVLLLFSTVPLFLLDSASFAKRFFFYSAVLSFISMLVLGIIWLSAPSLADSASNTMLSKYEISGDALAATQSLVPLLASWAQGYILKPMLLSAVIFITSIAAWFAIKSRQFYPAQLK